jgi:hypothetical protein
MSPSVEIYERIYFGVVSDKRREVRYGAKKNGVGGPLRNRRLQSPVRQ